MKMKKYFLMFAVILLSANGVKAQDGYLTNTFPDGSQFEGYFENGVINGTGVIYWNQKHYFVGNWINGKRNGHGIEVMPDGSYRLLYYENDNIVNRTVSSSQTLNTGVGIYTGEMVNGKACGKGTFQWNSGWSFDGTWTSDGKSRYGVLYWPNSQKIRKVGTWLNEKSEGYGCEISESGQITVGLWQNDEYKCKTMLNLSSDMEEIQRQLEMAQSALPIKITDGISISKLNIENNCYTIQYDVSDYSLYKNVKDNYTQMRKNLFEQMRQTMASDPFSRLLVEHNIQIKHVYHFVNSNDKTEFLFTVKELKSILN